MDTTWVILTCRPQMEFRCRDEIHDLGLSALVPVEFKLRYRQVNRRRRIDVHHISTMPINITETEPAHIRRPVLPGYIFAGLRSSDDWQAIRAVDGVRLPLRCDGRWAMLTDAQVRAVELLSQPAEQASTGSAYRIGDRIRIRRGAMAELQAAVLSVSGGKIVAVAEMFGKQHHVTVDAKQVEAA